MWAVSEFTKWLIQNRKIKPAKIKSAEIKTNSAGFVANSKVEIYWYLKISAVLNDTQEKAKLFTLLILIFIFNALLISMLLLLF